ncbi:PREDICTED: clavesin-1 isoform X2 [Nicrophorus vespilloides]|nr:PREDICTED: clavesin-1 isoform X2 [Nicrophorus vespilloides]
MASPFTMDTSGLTDEAKAIAVKELRETPENVKKGIEELRELLKNDNTIHYRDDDEFLMIFLRPCKFYAQSAYELMKRIANFKETHKALLENLLPEDEKNAFVNHNVVNVLTNRDHLGRRVLLVNVGSSWDTSKVTSDQLFRIFYLIHEAAILEPETQVRGCVVIMDFDGLSMKQVMAMSPAFSMKLLSFIQDAMPLRLKEVHMVKQPFIFNMVWNIFKPFIKEKLKKRIFFHGSKMSSLHKYMQPSHLPKNYDGQMPAINYTGADWYPAIDSHIEHIKNMNSYGLVKK